MGERGEGLVVDWDLGWRIGLFLYFCGVGCFIIWWKLVLFLVGKLGLKKVIYVLELIFLICFFVLGGF